jgi:hypothetical protein
MKKEILEPRMKLGSNTDLVPELQLGTREALTDMVRQIPKGTAKLNERTENGF